MAEEAVEKVAEKTTEKASSNTKKKDSSTTKVEVAPTSTKATIKKTPEKVEKKPPQRTVCQPTAQEIILAATTLTLLLAEGKSKYEIETLINLLSLTSRNLQSVLTQILINEKTPDLLDMIV